MLVSRKILTEVLDVTGTTIDNWTENGMPINIEKKGAPRYDLIDVLKWKYQDDWEYFLQKILTKGSVRN